MEFLLPLLMKLQDPATIVPMLGCIGLGYLLLVSRREDREDRKASLEMQARMVEALNDVKIALAALTGRAA